MDVGKLIAAAKKIINSKSDENSSVESRVQGRQYRAIVSTIEAIVMEDKNAYEKGLKMMETAKKLNEMKIESETLKEVNRDFIEFVVLFLRHYASKVGWKEAKEESPTEGKSVNESTEEKVRLIKWSTEVPRGPKVVKHPISVSLRIIKIENDENDTKSFKKFFRNTLINSESGFQDLKTPPKRRRLTTAELLDGVIRGRTGQTWECPSDDCLSRPRTIHRLHKHLQSFHPNLQVHARCEDCLTEMPFHLISNHILGCIHRQPGKDYVTYWPGEEIEEDDKEIKDQLSIVQKNINRLLKCSFAKCTEPMMESIEELLAHSRKIHGVLLNFQCFGCGLTRLGDFHGMIHHSIKNCEGKMIIPRFVHPDDVSYE